MPVTWVVRDIHIHMLVGGSTTWQEYTTTHTCQYLDVHRSVQLFSPIVMVPSLCLCENKHTQLRPAIVIAALCTIHAHIPVHTCCLRIY